MESAVSEKEASEAAPSYTYWVREVREDAAPLPVPQKLTPEDVSNNSQQTRTHLGSAWNRAGTWEEKNLNKWASDRIKLQGGMEPCLGLGYPNNFRNLIHARELSKSSSLDNIAVPHLYDLLISVGSLEFYGGRAEITEVSKCVGDAFLVMVRNKKRVGYTYELTLRVKGNWLIGEENKKVKGFVDIPEFSFGELDDLQFEVRLNEEKDFPHQDKQRISQDLKRFLQPVREKMLQFEEELKDR